MHFFNLYILAVEIAKTTESVASGNSFLHDWGTTIGGVFLAAVGGIFTWWNNRPKNKNDQFQVFMNESSEFREEVRKDKENLKAEVVALRLEIKDLQDKIHNCEKNGEKYVDELQKYKLQLQEANRELDILRVKANEFKERIVKLDGNGNGKT